MSTCDLKVERQRDNYVNNKKTIKIVVGGFYIVKKYLSMGKEGHGKENIMLRL